MPNVTFDHPFLRQARERVLILDGGMGTSLHKYRPAESDWGHGPDGKSLLNLSDALVYTHPEWIEENGESPICESYESRLAELLAIFQSNEHKSVA